MVAVTGSADAAMLAVRQSMADALASTRHGGGRVARARRRTEKELHHLIAAMQHASRHVVAVTGSADAAGDEVVGVITEATVTVASRGSRDSVRWPAAR